MKIQNTKNSELFRLNLKSMVSIQMINFCKTKNCPASQELLEFQMAKCSTAKNEAIGKHLNGCEFCAAEVEFYANCPQEAETVLETEIPHPLFELATALLGNKHKDFSLLDKLLCKGEPAKVC